jgi:hypothetical protein
MSKAPNLHLLMDGYQTSLETKLSAMPILTEPIGSIPRPASLLKALAASQAGQINDGALQDAYAAALRDTIKQFEQTGSPVITDGEQSKPSFATYPLTGLSNLAPDGVTIPFADGHVRQLPRLTARPFRYGVHAAGYLQAARRYTRLPIKQAVISASALSLLYPLRTSQRAIGSYHCHIARLVLTRTPGNSRESDSSEYQDIHQKVSEHQASLTSNKNRDCRRQEHDLQECSRNQRFYGPTCNRQALSSCMDVCGEDCH